MQATRKARPPAGRAPPQRASSASVRAPTRSACVEAARGQRASGDEVMTAVWGEIVSRRAAGNANRTRAVRAASSRAARADIDLRNADGVVAALPAFQTNGTPSRPIKEGSHAETNVT